MVITDVTRQKKLRVLVDKGNKSVMLGSYGKRRLRCYGHTGTKSATATLLSIDQVNRSPKSEIFVSASQGDAAPRTPRSGGRASLGAHLGVHFLFFV